MSDPEWGWIVRDEWSLINISTIKQFNIQELSDHRINYVNDPISREQWDTFTVAACSTEIQRCTVPKQVTVLIRYHNLYGKHFFTKLRQDKSLIYSCSINKLIRFELPEAKGYFVEPELLRNEVMKIWNMNRAPITTKHLLSQV